MEEISDILSNVIKQLFDVDFVPEVTVAPENMGADYSTNAAMKLNGILKDKREGVNPRAIADEITKAMSADRSFPFDVEVAGPGFLNFISRDEYFKQKLADLRLNFEKNISVAPDLKSPIHIFI